MGVTGLKKGGIYRHSDSMDELAKASFSYFLITLKENYLQVIKSKETATEQFQAFASIFMTLNNNDILVGGCPLMNAAIEANDSEILIEDAINRWLYSFSLPWKVHWPSADCIRISDI